MTAPVLIMAGGTGGHVFPALAVARALLDRDEQVIWLGTSRGLEAEVVPRQGIRLELIRVSGLRRKGLLAWLLAPFRLLVAVFDAIRIVRRLRPKVVLGMGGFASGPGGIAAWMLRRPLVIHEQNAVAGLTNRILARFAREIAEAFPGSFPAGVKTHRIGNPVRSEIMNLPDPEQRLSNRQGALRLLVLGGSQGALVLNRMVPRAVALLEEESRPEIWHQSGTATCEAACAEYETAGITARVEPFIDDMAAAYDWADLVICRAGALTITELMVAGLGAILVPYPAAADDHQTRNAEYLARVSAAVMMPEATLTPEQLADEIRACTEHREFILERARTVRKLAQPEATSSLVELCLNAGAGS